MILRGNFLVLNYSKNNPVMKPIKTLGIILGMTLTFGGVSVLVRPALAIFPTQQQLETSTDQINAESLFERSTEKINRGDYQGAIADLERVIALNPNYIEAYCNRGMAYFGLGNLDIAIAQFDLALKVAPRHADALNRKGVVLAQQGNLERAVDNFDRALNFDSNFVDAYYNRGKIRTELGNFQWAIADYNQAIKLNPNLAEAYGNRGIVRARLGNKQKGLEDLQHAAKLFLDSGNMAGYQQTLAYIQMIQR
jgi:tetratricopeptide (TPR) repeat protein